MVSLQRVSVPRVTGGFYNEFGVHADSGPARPTRRGPWSRGLRRRAGPCGPSHSSSAVGGPWPAVLGTSLLVPVCWVSSSLTWLVVLKGFERIATNERFGGIRGFYCIYRSISVKFWSLERTSWSLWFLWKTSSRPRESLSSFSWVASNHFHAHF